MPADPAQDVLALIDGRRVRLRNLDKVLYPATETTKGEVMDYYARIAPALLPLLAHRPVTRIRWPHGVSGPMFFEKNLPAGAPQWLESVPIGSEEHRGSRGRGEVVRYPLVPDLASLTYLVGLASLELHVPQWQVRDGEPQRPDRLVIDLDPGHLAGLRECAQVALTVADRLTDLGLSPVPVTSGSKGMQLYAGLDGEMSAEEVREVAKSIAQDLTRRQPDLVVWKMTKSLRPGKVLLDWSQNTAAKTTICPYSMRGRERPMIAAPRTWDEISNGAHEPGALQQLDFFEVLTRYAEDGDIFGDQISHDRLTRS